MILRAMRRLVRIPALIVWAVAHGLYALLFHVPRKDRVRLMAEQTRIWGRGLLFIFGIKLRIHGDLERYRKNGGLVVSNHLGYIDIFVHAATFGLRFTPKKEIRSWPVLGWYTSLTSPVWIDRTSPRKSLATLEEFRFTLKNRIPLIVYPEGTSTDGRSGILPFKSTSFETVAGTTIPVQPVLIFYRTRNKNDINPAWFGDMEFIPHLWRFLGNGKTVCDIFLLDEYSAPSNMDRKEIAADVREKMLRVYETHLASIRKEEAL